MIDIKGSVKLRKPLKSGGNDYNELNYDFGKLTNPAKYMKMMDTGLAQNIFVPSDTQKLKVFAASVTDDGIDEKDILERLSARDAQTACDIGDKWFRALDNMIATHVKYDEGDIEEDGEEGAMRPAAGVIVPDEPIEYNGLEINEIRFDFESMTAAQLAAAKDKAPKKTVGIYSFEQAYYVFLESVKAAKTTNVQAVREKASIPDVMCGVAAAWVFCLSAARLG